MGRAGIPRTPWLHGPDPLAVAGREVDACRCSEEPNWGQVGVKDPCELYRLVYNMIFSPLY